LRSTEEEREHGLRDGDDEIQQLNDRLYGAEVLGRDLRAEMHRLQQRVAQSRTRIDKYKVREVHAYLPREAMLALYMMSSCVSLSVSVSLSVRLSVDLFENEGLLNVTAKPLTYTVNLVIFRKLCQIESLLVQTSNRK